MHKAEIRQHTQQHNQPKLLFSKYEQGRSNFHNIQTPSFRVRAGTSPRRSTRIAILGSKQVGKSTIADWFVNEWLAKEFVSTISGHHLLMTDSMTVDLIDNDYHDLPFTSVMKMNLRRADGFVLVYSVDDESSFEYVRQQREEIIRIRGHHLPIVVVGNKTDQQTRHINPVVADCIVTMDWEHQHVEVSALKRRELQVVFEVLFTHPVIRQKTGYCSIKRDRAKSLPNCEMPISKSRKGVNSFMKFINVLKRKESSDSLTPAGTKSKKLLNRKVPCK
ncbi:GTP-binding protein Rheb homolog 1-like [Mya arenaria]|uniref:GTP-binding protein Rheb homolog 1-like n=1 Tax=Mya arenaria TaxID=6604 RepID=UPI0022E493EB|nr:GTP-binding protein Rheb homolog 1-like [Mya arenaria]